MQLAKYLDDNEISDAAFARSIGVERQAVGRYRAGDRFPEKQILLEIFKVTNGQVTANDFAGLPTETEIAPSAESAASDQETAA